MNPNDTEAVAAANTQREDTVEIRSALLDASFDLLNDEITGPEWMGHLAKLAHCESAYCTWWRAGRPEDALLDVHGTDPHFPDDLMTHLDELVARIAPSAPGFIDELARQAAAPLGLTVENYLTPDKLVICIDWKPACVFFIFSDRCESPDWQSADRDRLAAVLPTIRKSLQIKKSLSRKEDFLELSKKVIDAYTHGIATLTTDGDVITFNHIAKEILEDGSLARVRDNKLELQNKSQQSQFRAQLAQLNQIATDELPAFSWYCSLGRDHEAKQLLMTMKATSMLNWRMESSSDSRVVVVTLDRMDQPVVTSEQQLRDCYGLSKAQARFARALLLAESIEAAADNCNISKNTARCHLRAIYAKVGVDGLSKLMLRLGRISPGITESLG